ncbi:MAG: hypothetical protein IPJ71_02715 [Bdellovibrionales bacterium]|nr:hypothetical protein [Bdellovibrionales bacterium]
MENEATFYKTHEELRDPVYGFHIHLKGHPLKTKKNITFKGEPVVLFHYLGSGTTGRIYLGSYRNGIALFKIYKLSGESARRMMEREVFVSSFLAHKGLRVAEIVDYSPAEGIVIKRYHPGIERDELHREVGKPIQAERQFQDLVSAVRRIETDTIFQKEMDQRNFERVFDITAVEPQLDNGNVIFSLGSWVIVDP